MTTHATDLPRAVSSSRSAPLRGDRTMLIQTVLFLAGGILLPLGIVVICLGWYGIAHTPYEYNQLVYIVSGGLLGLGLTFVGGFLYFGAWIARSSAEQKATNKRLTDALLELSYAVSRTTTPASARYSTLVVAGTSTTVHRADCSLIEGRTDLSPAGPGGPGLTACRLCQPELTR